MVFCLERKMYLKKKHPKTLICKKLLAVTILPRMEDERVPAVQWPGAWLSNPFPPSSVE